MKWTNRYGVSPIIAEAIMNDGYDPGDCDITVTSLIDSPYVRYQKSRPEFKDVEVEFSSMIYALLGKLVHGILETGMAGLGNDKIMDVIAATGIVYEDLDVEERLFAQDKGWTWSGQYDLYYSRRVNGEKLWVLEDHKLCSVGEFSAQRGEDKWTKQLNLLALLCRRNGMPVDELAINAYFRDWSKMRAAHDRTNEYPPSQHQRILIDLWPQHVQQAYLEERIRKHQQNPPPPCSPEERWEREPKWRVLPRGAKRGRLFPSREEAMSYIDYVVGQLNDRLAAATEMKPTSKAGLAAKQKKRAKLKEEIFNIQTATVEPAGGIPIRCKFYCQAASICPAYQQTLEVQS